MWYVKLDKESPLEELEILKKIKRLEEEYISLEGDYKPNDWTKELLS